MTDQLTVARMHAYLAKVPRDEVNTWGGRVTLTVRVFGKPSKQSSPATAMTLVLADTSTAAAAWELLERFGSIFAGKPPQVPEAIAHLETLLAPEFNGGSETDRSDALRRTNQAIRGALKTLQTHQLTSNPGEYRNVFKRIIRAGWWPEITPPMVEGRAPNMYGPHDARNLAGTSIESHFMERAALAHGLETIRLSRKHFTAIAPNGKQAVFHQTGSPALSSSVPAISRDKEATRYLLQQGGIPVPVGRSFAPDMVEQALDYAGAIGFPVTVKPLAGNAGTGVFTGASNREHVAGAIERIRQSEFGKTPFIVEEHIHGDAYRVFVVGNQVQSMVRYEHGTITGEGELTVGELLLQKDLIRWPNPHLGKRRIKLDDAVMQRLSDEELTLDTVLEPGRRVVFTANPNFNQGGESIEVLEETHPSILEAAVQAIEVVPGLSFSGVDFIIPDHTAPLDEQRAAICEINARPVIGSGVFPLYGPRQDAPGALIRHVAKLQGLQVTEKQDELSVRLTATGRVQGVYFRRWIANRAQAAGLSGWVRNTTNQKVQAVIAGATDAVAGLVSATAYGPRRATPRMVRTTHVPRPSLDEFRIRSTSAEEA